MKLNHILTVFAIGYLVNQVDRRQNKRVKKQVIDTLTELAKNEAKSDTKINYYMPRSGV